jgi:hypothetical protein
MTVFWSVKPCGLVQIDRRFRYSYRISLMVGAVRTSETSVTSMTIYDLTSSNNASCSLCINFPNYNLI